MSLWAFLLFSDASDETCDRALPERGYLFGDAVAPLLVLRQVEPGNTRHHLATPAPSARYRTALNSRLLQSRLRLQHTFRMPQALWQSRLCGTFCSGKLRLVWQMLTAHFPQPLRSDRPLLITSFQRAAALSLPTSLD